MKLLNYREGFASNSSSTHFTHFTDNIDDKQVLSQYGFSTTFIATGRDELLRYVGAQINANLDPGMADLHRKSVIDGLLGLSLSDRPEDYAITRLTLPDDQIWTLPRAKGDMSNLPNPEFVRDVIAHVLAHKRMILEWELGDADNPYDEVLDNIISIETPHKENMEICAEYIKRGIFERSPDRIEYLHTDAIVDDVRYRLGGDSQYCVKEDGVWKFFEKEGGRKVRFTFDTGKKVYKKSTTPELVDLIVSNKCSRGCSYCYRDCTETGREADLGTIKKYVHDLATSNVFEIVIGGGDILEYHKFDALMAFLGEVRKISDTTFTTTIRATPLPHWSYWSDIAGEYRKKEFAAKLEAVAKTFSGVAVSVEDGRDLLEFVNNYYGCFRDNNCQVTVQIIPEATHGKQVIDHIMEICEDHPGLRIVLLGFKRTGRAAGELYPYIERNIEELRNDREYIRSIVKRPVRGIGMDTQFIKNFPFLKRGMQHGEYTTREGAFSCCIDATNHTMTKSSYEGLDKPVIIDPDKDIAAQMIAGFAKF